jgi:hypothetical protein
MRRTAGRKCDNMVMYELKISVEILIYHVKMGTSIVRLRYKYQVSTYFSNFNDEFTDNAVDRDPAPESPMLFSSSLKKNIKIKNQKNSQDRNHSNSYLIIIVRSYHSRVVLQSTILNLPLLVFYSI